MTAEHAAAVVAQGAALLDAQRPGWAGRIDLERLEMTDECACVLGQLEGDFWRGLSRLREQIPKGDGLGATYGFHCGDDYDRATQGPDISDAAIIAYELLEAAWVAEIRKRLEGRHVEA